MKSFASRLQEAQKILSNVAVPHSGGLGRATPEKEDSTRFRFQRDRGRIVHTEAFRRLKGKTQVFVGGGGDHFRTRLTHTLEVAGVSRDIARTLSLNEDLAECIALAHDLGHPPFGHAGETALHSWMEQFGKSFEHNLQSHKIVTSLESHSATFTGLNLNVEVLDGLLKHYTPHDNPTGPTTTRSPSLEAQVVNLADEIAYTAHDCEDGLQSGLLSATSIQRNALIQRATSASSKKGTSLRGAIIELLVSDIYNEIEIKLSLQCIDTLDDVYRSKEPSVRFSHTTRQELDELRGYLFEHMYNHPEVQNRSNAGKEIVLNLCEILYKNPNEKILQNVQSQKIDIEDAVKNYVCGMTDSYAFYQADKLQLLGEGTIKNLEHKVE